VSDRERTKEREREGGRCVCVCARARARASAHFLTPSGRETKRENLWSDGTFDTVMRPLIQSGQGIRILVGAVGRKYLVIKS